MMTFYKIFTANPLQVYWKLLFWLILGSLLYLTLTPSPPEPIRLRNIDKLYHFIAFAGFSFVFKIAYKQFQNIFIIIASGILAILIEVIQYYIPGRGFSFADMLADASGIFVGVWVAFLMLRLKS